MLSKEKQEELMGILGSLTEEQKEVLITALKNPVSDRELFEKLGGVEEEKFARFLKALAAETEKAVMGQELSLDEIETASGGLGDRDGNDCAYNQSLNCISWEKRYAYQGGFPNCAATVEDGSFCGRNDACYDEAVGYLDLKDCAKAWR